MRRSTGILAAATIALAACDESVVPPVPVALVVPDSVMVLEDDSVTVPGYLLDADGDTLPPAPTAWVAADTTVVSAGLLGVVRFRRAGRTTVGVLSAGFAATVPVTAAVRYAGMAGGAYYRWCGLTDRGALYCFPSGSLTGSPGDSLVAVRVSSNAAVREVSLGGEHACLLTVNDEAFCWGYNDHGQLGYDTSTGRVDIPVPVQGDFRFRTISTGSDHTCGVTTSGAAYCWGWDWNGRLGDGDSASSREEPAPPRPVAGGLTFQAIAAGAAHTCGIDLDGVLWCWGSNEYGELGIGQGSVVEVYAPVQANTAARFIWLGAGGLHTCALAANHIAYCWGLASGGALGSTGAAPCPQWPGFTCELSPKPVDTWLRFTTLHTSGNELYSGTTCGLTPQGAAWCWGENRYGETGRGSPGQHTSPAEVIGGFTFTAIAGGDYETCGLDADHVVRCWGRAFGLSPARLPFQQ